MKRRNHSSEEELRIQVLRAPEVSLNGVPGTSAKLLQTALRCKLNRVPFPSMDRLCRERADLAGLPWQRGATCKLGKEPAENLEVLSQKLREQLAACLPRDGIDRRPNPDRLRRQLVENRAAEQDWLRPEAVPVLVQMLQTENKPVRLVLIEVLSRIPGRQAATALAQRAIYDLAPEVREAAVRALHKRPYDLVRDQLVAGLRHPWPAAADHAAEALASLDDQDAVPLVLHVLKDPDPAAPFPVCKGKGKSLAIREMVRINHLGNCLLCHAPTHVATDPVRAAIPVPGQPLPAPGTSTSPYGQGGTLIRADVTYLRQDFSVMQPVDEPGAWPGYQRYDYVVHTRQLSAQEAHRLHLTVLDESRSGQREAVLFALRELTARKTGYRKKAGR
jgi:hypothetical protein